MYRSQEKIGSAGGHHRSVVVLSLLLPKSVWTSVLPRSRRTAFQATRLCREMPAHSAHIVPEHTTTSTHNFHGFRHS